MHTWWNVYLTNLIISLRPAVLKWWRCQARYSQEPVLLGLTKLWIGWIIITCNTLWLVWFRPFLAIFLRGTIRTSWRIILHNFMGRFGIFCNVKILTYKISYCHRASKQSPSRRPILIRFKNMIIIRWPSCFIRVSWSTSSVLHIFLFGPIHRYICRIWRLNTRPYNNSWLFLIMNLVITYLILIL